jgi:hypothetical protein
LDSEWLARMRSSMTLWCGGLNDLFVLLSVPRLSRLDRHSCSILCEESVASSRVCTVPLIITG